MKYENQKIYCFDINTEQEGVWDGTNDFCHMIRNDKNEVNESPHQLVLFEYKLCSEKLNLITNSNDINYGKTIIYKTKNKSYIFKIRKQGLTESGCKIRENNEYYLKYIYFLKNAFQLKQLYSEEQENKNQNNTQLQIKL